MTLTVRPDRAPTGPRPPPRARWIDDWRPEDETFWAETGQRGGPAQPGLVDLRRAPRLLGLADLERQLGVPGRHGLRAITRSSCSSWWRCPTWSASLLRLPYTFAVPKFGGRNWTMASAALLLVPTLGFAYAVQQPEHAVLGVLPDRGHRRARRRQLRQLDGQHQLLLPGRQEGRRARAQRRRRQPRRRADPALPAGDRRRRRRSSAWSRRPTAASTSSGRPGSTPGSRSWPRSRRTSSWTTSAPRKSSAARAAAGGPQAADLDHGVPLHRHLRLVHRLLRRDAAADQAELLGRPTRRRSAPASTSPTSRSSAPWSAR